MARAKVNLARSARRLRILVLTIGLGSAVASGNAKPHGETNQPVSFQLLRGHIIVVEGTVGLLNRRRIVLDTGSSPTILEAALARQLGIDGAPSRLEMFSGTSLVRTGVLSKLTLGPVTAKSLPVMLSDLSFMQRDVGVRIDAIVGLDVISTSFVIDYTSKELRFGALPQLPKSVPFETGPPLITVNMTVQGKPARLLVDTGASGSLLFRKEHRFDLLPVLRRQTATNISGAFEREQVELSDLRLGDADFGRHIAYLANATESVAKERNLLSWK